MATKNEEQTPITAMENGTTTSLPTDTPMNGANGTAADATSTPPEDCGCGTNEKDIDVSEALPTAEMLKKCADLPVYDADGKQHTFKNMVEGDGSGQKHMVIFIRHFFCGLCQEYVRSLALSFPPSLLPPSTSLTIISCGSPDLITNYTATTSCPYTIYCDPKAQLYSALGMQKGMMMGSRRPEYIKRNMFLASVQSVVQGLTWRGGRGALKGGDFTQKGGEFLFVRGSDGELKVEWCHRMRNTRDHNEIEELKRVMGIAESPDAEAPVNTNGGNEVHKEEEKKEERVDNTPTVTVLNDYGEVQKPETTVEVPESKRRTSILMRGISWRKSQTGNVSNGGESKGKEKAGYTKLGEEGGAESGNRAIEVA